MKCGPLTLPTAGMPAAAPFGRAVNVSPDGYCDAVTSSQPLSVITYDRPPEVIRSGIVEVARRNANDSDVSSRALRAIGVPLAASGTTYVPPSVSSRYGFFASR